MSYIDFQDDPIAERFNASYTDLCYGDPTKRVLKMLDRCFVIYNRSMTDSKFCDFQNLLYPVDSSLLIDFEVCAGETLSIYDNSLESILPSTPNGAVGNYPFGSEGEYIVPIGYSGTSGSSGTSGTSGATPLYDLLSSDRPYARACILYVYYPKVDKLGNDINPGNMNCSLSVYDSSNHESTITIGQIYCYFGNPVTSNVSNLINKIEVTNPNQNFSIKVKGMVIYVKSNIDPNDCGC